jgi:hypothetical protein
MLFTMQTTTDSREYQNAKKNTKPEPPACNCTDSFDLRARCYPPSSALACKFGSDNLGWFKYLGHEDNWEHCPVRVDTAKEHLVNSRCTYDDGHNEAKWRKASALIGLTEAETEAVIAMQFHEPESDEDSDNEDCDVVAEDGGSLHVVPVSELDEGKKKATKLMLASGYGKAMGKQ